jgi:hypothetical protein
MGAGEVIIKLAEAVQLLGSAINSAHVEDFETSRKMAQYAVGLIQEALKLGCTREWVEVDWLTGDIDEALPPGAPTSS